MRRGMGITWLLGRICQMFVSSAKSCQKLPSRTLAPHLAARASRFRSRVDRSRARGFAVNFRTLPRFETAEAKYSFLNRLLAVGKGEIRADGPVHVIEELL